MIRPWQNKTSSDNTYSGDKYMPFLACVGNAFANKPLLKNVPNKQSLEIVQSCNETVLFF